MLCESKVRAMVSVIIPTYNREKVIREAAISVLKQTYRDLELIIVDDGSTDATARVVEELGDPRVKYVVQENAGACVARNRGISVARGEYIAFQDSDDTWTADKLEKQIGVLGQDPSVDIVCCRTILKRLDGTTIVTANRVKEGLIDQKTGPVGFSTQTLVMRRSVVEKVLFDPKVTRYQDLDFLISAMRAGFTLYCVDECLVERTNRSDSITNHPGRAYDMAKYFETKYADIFEERDNFLSRFFSSVLLEAASALKKNHKEYKHVYQEALRLDHSPKTVGKYLMLQTGVFGLYKRLRHS